MTMLVVSWALCGASVFCTAIVVYFRVHDRKQSYNLHATVPEQDLLTSPLLLAETVDLSLSQPSSSSVDARLGRRESDTKLPAENEKLGEA